MKFTSVAVWLSSDPPDGMVSFFEGFMIYGASLFAWSYKLGSDLDYIIGNIERVLGETIHTNLRDTFHARNTDIPLPVLSRSIASLYIGLIRSWFSDFQSMNVIDYVTHIHRMSGALIREALC